MKKFYGLVIVLVLFVQCFAMKNSTSLDSLYLGMPERDVVSFLGEPRLSMSYMINHRKLFYDIYNLDGNIGDYRIYFKNDTLCKLCEVIKNKEVEIPITGEKFEVDKYETLKKTRYKDIAFEGKCLVVTKVLENITLSNDQIFDAVLSGISHACNGSLGEYKMKESSHILYHGIIDKVITFDWKWGSINVYYTIDVAIKQGRMRIKVIGDEIDWHQDYEKATYLFNDIIPFGHELMKGVTEDESILVVDNTIEKFNQFISAIEHEVAYKAEDDW